MSFYRNTYLRSEHWQNLRLQRILRQKGNCYLCRKQFGLALDVHHIVYRNLYNVRKTDLRALCRPCHDLVHRILRLTDSDRGCPSLLWKFLRRRIFKWRKWAEKHGVGYADSKVLLDYCFQPYLRAKTKFRALRKAVRLTIDPTVNSRTMPWNHDFVLWVNGMPEMMSPKIFYRQWLRKVPVSLIDQPGEH